MLRYALSCPKHVAKAGEYIQAERKRDKEFAADVEELLKLDTEQPAK